jgi:D-alanyl-D-alanine carboxypeptidase-like protein
MNRGWRTALIGIGGVAVGALVMLALPAPGRLPSRTDAPSARATPSVRVEKAAPSTLLVWTPGAVPSGLADAARRVSGVEAVAEVRSGAAWLSSWRDDVARTHTAPRSVPIEIAAVDPAVYRAFVPPDEQTSIDQLARGGIVLGDGGAKLREIEHTGTLEFGDVALDVAGVIDDGLIGAHEGVVSYDTGAEIGIDRLRYLLLDLERGANIATIETQLRSLAPQGTKLRIRAPGETPEFRHGDAVLPPVRLKELFGEFSATPSSGGDIDIDPAWVQDHIQTIVMPIVGIVRCNRAIVPQMNAALEEIIRRGLTDLIDPADFGGCFSSRFLSQDPNAGISHHSWGVAFDLNVSKNPFGKESNMDRRIVDIFERWGFTWGGRWLVPDGMHFEYLRTPLSPKG